MTRSLGAKVLALVLGASLLAACTSNSDDEPEATGPVELSFWSWAPKIETLVDRWNADNPDIKVTLSRQAGGADIITKLLTAAKAGNPPDLAQVEYQALPTLVSNDVLADIAEQAKPLKEKFAEGTWQQVTLGTDAVYAIPQDAAPMMLYYRTDLFRQFGLTVPKTWEEFAQTARTLRSKSTKHHLTTFSATDPGWFAGLAQQAGASWWGIDGESWRVSVNDAATKKVADYWSGLVAEGVVDGKPMYTPEWNKSLNDGSLLAWPGAVWGPGVLSGNAPETKGKWAMAPLPQWSAGENRTGNWGGSSTGVTAASKHKAAAVKFASWLNTDPAATTMLVRECAVYPAARDAQAGPALAQPPDFFAGQADFYPVAKQIADTAAGVTWGPNVNVTYQAYQDEFAKAITARAPFSTAVEAMQAATVADMRKNGFTVAG
ncbi:MULTISPECIES: ABC transporter substrate-binding protein [unclassified Plantactinospora]|uniref:ABC transporter substrate-binding protein n=1 Tax=unclassified Plantactinospora TaxID=2631981 RepID=UPI000D17627D|nr:MULTISPECIES: extracellular solute-binding protein [unclassified Plantactinospora]AVT30749.1 sugar ABC transporter substrate-binding protein [Plantactinospora sp. BC1]AVT37441.1 sugar ABC transporter substrate-binding protein [Plantactinospora sp. BB1]